MKLVDEKPIIEFNLKVIICKILGHKTYEAKCRGEFFGYQCIRCDSRFSFWVGKPDYPNFKEIVNNCKKKIKEKFPDYGNSWVSFSDKSFWKKRTKEEFDEIWLSESPEQMKNEIDDLINILSMTRENVDEFLFEEIQSTEDVKLD